MKNPSFKNPIFTFCLCLLGLFACQHQEKDRLKPEIAPAPIYQKQEIDLKVLTDLENVIGFAEYADLLAEKSLEELDAFYHQLPRLVQEQQKSEAYLSVLQHNLIVSMVMNHELLEADKDKVDYYTQEFTRLGASHPQVARAFCIASEQLKTTEKSYYPILLANASEAEEYHQVKSVIKSIQTMK